jgi:hypothetical protein
MENLIIVSIVVFTLGILITLLKFRKKIPFISPTDQYIQNNGPFFRICRLIGLFLFIILAILHFGYHIEAGFINLFSIVALTFCVIGSSSKKVLTKKEKSSPE